jgi:hypothetical protein
MLGGFTAGWLIGVGCVCASPQCDASERLANAPHMESRVVAMIGTRFFPLTQGAVEAPDLFRGSLARHGIFPRYCSADCTPASACRRVVS